MQCIINIFRQCFTDPRYFFQRLTIRLFDFMQAFDAEVYKMQKAGEIERLMLEAAD